MFVTTHSLVTMTVAVKTGNPYIYIPFAALDHFLLDQLPHFGLKKFTMQKFKILTFFDALVGISVFIAVFLISGWPIGILVLLCFLAGWPDILWFVKIGGNNWLEGFKDFHKKIQKLESHWGALVEAVVIVVCFILLVN